MKIIDTFTFFNELDLLEIRLSEMYNHVDRFVIVESDYTFTGKYKGFMFEDNKSRYLQWIDKICYIKAHDPPNNGNPWDNEKWQRSWFSKGWENLNDNDVIIISDVDEIIRPGAIDLIKNTDHGLYVLNMPLFDFRLNFMRRHYPWHCARAIRGLRIGGEEMRKCTAVPNKTTVTIDHAGWHFSWQGNDSNIINKIKSFSHSEYNNDHFINAVDVDKLISTEKNIFQIDMIAVKIDDYFPKSLTTNLEKYQSMIISNASASVHDIFPLISTKIL